MNCLHIAQGSYNILSLISKSPLPFAIVLGNHLRQTETGIQSKTLTICPFLSCSICSWWRFKIKSGAAGQPRKRFPAPLSARALGHPDWRQQSRWGFTTATESAESIATDGLGANSRNRCLVKRTERSASAESQTLLERCATGPGHAAAAGFSGWSSEHSWSRLCWP